MTPPHSSDNDRPADDGHPAPKGARLRAGDEERDAVLDILARAHGAGRLDPEEIDERQRATLGARFVDELPDLIDDLPEGQELARRFAQVTGQSPPEPPPVRGTSLVPVHRGEIQPAAPGTGPPENSIAILSGREIHVEPGTGIVRSYSLMGGDEVFLSDVLAPGVEITLESYAMWSGNDIFVPAGVKIVDKTINFMAGNTIAKNARGDGSNGVVILTGFSLMAGHDVKLDPNWMPHGRLER